MNRLPPPSVQDIAKLVPIRKDLVSSFSHESTATKVYQWIMAYEVPVAAFFFLYIYIYFKLKDLAILWGLMRGGLLKQILPSALIGRGKVRGDRTYQLDMLQIESEREREQVTYRGNEAT